MRMVCIREHHETGDRDGEGSAYYNIGGSLNSLEKYEEAIAHYQEALEIAQETGDRGGEGSAYNGIGAVLDSLGKYEAMEHYKKSLEIRAGDGQQGRRGLRVQRHRLFPGLAWEVRGGHSALQEGFGDRAGER
jgi:tetratricopeptide (TPR) repeat protein